MDRARAVKAFLSPEAEQWLTQYYAAPGRHPPTLLRELGRTVELVSISKDPERNLCRVVLTFSLIFLTESVDIKCTTA